MRSKTIELCFADTHLILRQRTCLVSTDDSSSTHRFAGVHLTNQVVALEHTAHGISQTERYCHGQTFGHCHDNHGDSYHEGAEETRYEIEPIDAAGVIRKIKSGASYENQDGDGVTDFGNELAQTVQLLIERGFHAVVNLCRFEHSTVFGGIAHSSDTADGVTFHDLRTAQHVVRGESGFFVKLFGNSGFATEGFAREGALIHAEMCGFEEFGIGRDVFTGAEHHDVTHHDVTFGHFGGVAFADDTHRLFVIDLIENFEFLVRLLFKVEGESCGKENGNEDTHGFKKDRSFMVQPKVFIGSDA